MRGRLAILCAGVALLAVSAAGQIRKADFVILAGDTDDAIRLAKVIKELFATDPGARRAVSLARDALLQSWVEEKNPLQLTDQERAVLQNPERLDTPILHDIQVAFAASPPLIVLVWDVPPRLWPRLVSAVAPTANRILRDGAYFARRAMQLRVKLQDIEMYRVNADVDGNLTVVFTYD